MTRLYGETLRQHLLCLATLVVLASPDGVLAQEGVQAPQPAESERETAAYHAHVSRALSAQREGDFEAAHDAFAAAHALAPSARTLRGMGISSFQAGRHARALEELEAALVHDTRRLDGKLREDALHLVAHARKQVGTIVLNVTPAAAVVTVDDLPEQRPVSAPLILDGGGHSLSLRAEGHAEQSIGLEVVPQLTQNLSVALLPVAEPMPVAAASPALQVTVPQDALRPANPGVATPRRDQPRPLEAASTLRKAGFWSALSLAAGSGAAGLSLLLVGNGRVDKIDRRCRTRESGQCTVAEFDASLRKYEIERLEHAMTATVTTSAVLLALSASFLAWEFRATGRIGLVLSPRHAGIGARF
jgi:tetratricopeptide (TPR) repeat protein